MPKKSNNVPSLIKVFTEAKILKSEVRVRTEKCSNLLIKHLISTLCRTDGSKPNITHNPDIVCINKPDFCDEVFLCLTHQSRPSCGFCVKVRQAEDKFKKVNYFIVATISNLHCNISK